MSHLNNPSAQDLGEFFPDYSIVKKEIDQAYFATYLIYHKKLSRHATLYRINTENLSNTKRKQYTSSFNRLKTLKHSNILGILEFWMEDSIFYIATEEVRDLSLEDMIEKQGRLALKECLVVGLQLCSAVEFLSFRDIYHTCLNPNDLYINEESYLKISPPCVKRLLIDCNPRMVTNTHFAQFSYKDIFPEDLMENEVKSISALICYVSTGYSAYSLRKDKWVENGMHPELVKIVGAISRNPEHHGVNIGELFAVLEKMQQAHVKQQDITQSLTATKLHLSKATRPINLDTKILKLKSIADDLTKQIKTKQEVEEKPEDLSDLFNQRYRIKEKIEQSSIRAVYIAEDIHMLGTTVFLHIYEKTKVVNFAKKFRNVFGRVQAITNPHVSRIYEQTTVDGVSFLSIQRERGEKLADFIARKRPNSLEVLQFCRQILKTLHLAQRVGLSSLSIHYENIYVYKDADGSYMYRLSSIGTFALSYMMMGKDYAFEKLNHPETLAPEMFHKKTYDGQTLQFILGQMVYKLILGKHPCSQMTLTEAYEFHKSNPGYEITEQRKDIPILFQKWINTLIHPEPKQRFKDYETAIKELEKTQQKFSVPMRPF